MEVTIIIILHNRHHNIERLVKYYEGTPAQFILADSSKISYNASSLPENWQHIYTPNINYTQKIETVLHSVTTKYVVLCADDDFVIPEAVGKCVAFLDENTDYASVQGQILCFKKRELIENKVAKFYPLYDARNYSFEDTHPLKRLEELFANYKSYLYAVHHTAILKEAFAGASASIKNLYLNEYAVSALPIVKGKYRELDFLYQVREYAEDSDDKTAININTIVKDDIYKKDLDLFVDFLSKKINVWLPEQNMDVLRMQLLTWIQSLANEIDKRANLRPNFKKQIGILIAKIPIIGKPLIEANRKAELNNQMAKIVKSNTDRLELNSIKVLLENL